MNQSGTGTRNQIQGNEPNSSPGIPGCATPKTDSIMAILESLGLEPSSSKNLETAFSTLVPAKGQDGQDFLLKYYRPCPTPCFDPGLNPETRSLDREFSFYRYLDIVDRDRCFANIPRMIIVDQQEKPEWILLEGIPGVSAAKTNEVRPDWLVDTLRSLQDFPAHLTDGRRGLILERWDSYAHREVIFKMRELVEPRVGEKAWDLLCRTLNEAREWTDSSEPILVNGWFEDNNLLIDEGGRIFQHDFRRVGLGSHDIDFAWYWLSCTRDQEWKKNLYQIYCSSMDTSSKLKTDWAARSVAIYLACLQVANRHETEDISDSLELLERGILGGTNIFP